MSANNYSLKGKTVVVTGGAGFVGSHLVDRIIEEQPKDLIILSNFFLGHERNLAKAIGNFPQLKTIRCNVNDFSEVEEVFKENNVDVVFNLAVIPLPTSLTRPEWTIRQNIDMTLNICNLQRLGKFQHLVQFSSSEACGSAKTVPMNEDHPMDPETPYAASKAATDHIALSYHHTFGCDVTVIRPFNQYGPRQNAQKYAGIIPLIVGRMKRGEEVFIHGDGEQTRDFIHVRDTVEGTIAAYKTAKSRGRVIHVASGSEVKIKDLVHNIADLMNYPKTKISHKPERPGDVRRHFSGTKLAQELLGWKAQISFADGLKETVGWYVDHPEVYL
jgi:UDP-glucose 4-epimerase